MAPLVAVALSLGWATQGCTRYVTLEQLPQAYYQTAYPGHDVSLPLEEAFQAVKRIRVTGVYDHFWFSPESAPLEGDRLGAEALSRAVEVTNSSTSREASAVQIALAGLKATLLTNQHAIHFPDTLVEYFEVAGATPAPTGRRPVACVSVKRGQFNFVFDRTGIRPFELLVQDPAADLALLGALYPADTEPSALSVLRVAVGDSERLSWGSFVYVLGYPGGYRMVTTGIVSDPGRSSSSSSSFLIDGLWNEGTSGGPILAVRGVDGSLEWVGLARASGGRKEHQLVPDPDLLESQDQRVLYEGRIYLQEVQRILYGISLSVPMTTIREFLDRSQADLRRRGWNLPSF